MDTSSSFGNVTTLHLAFYYNNTTLLLLASLESSRVFAAEPGSWSARQRKTSSTMQMGIGAKVTELPLGEPVQLDDLDEKTIQMWLLYSEAWRADAVGI